MSKSWRDDPPVLAPQHAVDLLITDYYTPLIEAALLRLWTSTDLAAAIVAAQNAVPVRKDDTAPALDADTLAAMRSKVADILGSRMSTDELETLIRQVWADAYLAGGTAASQALTAAGLTVNAGVSGQSSLLDFTDWKPGNPAAAALADNGGWQAALTRASTTITGIADTQMALIGTAITDGLAAGSSVDTIAADLTDTVGSASRAEMIAHTETARMLTDASLATYSANGIAQWDLIVSSGACKVCLNVEAANPHAMGDQSAPLHPFCRCAAAPHVAA